MPSALIYKVDNKYMQYSIWLQCMNHMEMRWNEPWSSLLQGRDRQSMFNFRGRWGEYQADPWHGTYERPSFCGGCTSRVGVFASIFGLSQLRRPVLTPKVGLASHLAIYLETSPQVRPRSFFFQIWTVAAKIFGHLRNKNSSDYAETATVCCIPQAMVFAKGAPFKIFQNLLHNSQILCSSWFISTNWILIFGMQVSFNDLEGKQDSSEGWAKPKQISELKAYSSGLLALGENKQETQHCCTNAQNMQHFTIVYWYLRKTAGVWIWYWILISLSAMRAFDRVCQEDIAWLYNGKKWKE